MSVLMIGETEREAIRQIVQFAKDNPVSIEEVMAAPRMPDTTVLAYEGRGEIKPRSRGEITLPGGFRCCLSVQHQPAGYCTHLSISVEGRPKKGAMAHPAAVEMIANEFGVGYPADKMWIEEFEPGEYAINLLSLFWPTTPGNA